MEVARNGAVEGGPAQFRRLRGGAAALAAAAALGVAAATLLQWAATATSRAPSATGEGAGERSSRPRLGSSPRAAAAEFAGASRSRQRELLREIAAAEPALRRELLRSLPPAAEPRVRGVQAALLAIDGPGAALPPWLADPQAEPLERDRLLAALLLRGDAGVAASIGSDPSAPWRQLAALPDADPAEAAEIRGRLGDGRSVPPAVDLHAAASDPARAAFERRLAAALLREEPRRLDASLASELASLPAADPEGGVAAAVLAAESLLTREDAVEAARAWLRSFDDDAKRAGLLLLALVATGEEAAPLLAAPLWGRAEPELRRAHAAAELALGRWSRRSAPAELFARIARRPDGGIDLDLLLGRLAAGDADAAESLLDLPDPPVAADAAAIAAFERDLALRGALRRRFLPSLQRAIGDPAGAEPRGLSLHRDLALARWWLDRASTSFDPALRAWSARP